MAVWINEIHYDDATASGDVNEGVEIAGTAGTDLTGWKILLYNGSGGAFYATIPLSGTIPNQQNGFGTIWSGLPTNGVQNGAPDGVALINNLGQVVQFLSYEGSFVATNGEAIGMTSVDIGVAETGTTPAGHSLQLTGTGDSYDDFTWASAATHTRGAANNGQTFSGAPALPTLSIDDVTQVESDAGTVTFTFTVSLSAPADPGGVTFDIATADGTATTADSDYVANSLTGQTIPAGSSTYAFNVTVNADSLAEANEIFFVNVTNVTGATVADGQGQGTITNDDTPGALGIGDVTLAEGNSGTTAFTFTVTRTGGSEGAVGATWSLSAPGGAGVADSGDFSVSQPATGSVSFADGETSKTITVEVAGDAVVESDETFSVILSAPSGGATISDDTGIGTIQNDDSAGQLSIGDVTLAEGNVGETDFTFTVTRSGGSGGAVSATWTIDVPGGAGQAAGTDLGDTQALTGSVDFADGETSKTITVKVKGDYVVESDETFTVTLSAPTGTATLGDAIGLGTITNDDATPAASVGDAAIVEGNSGVSYLVFTISLTSPAAGGETVDYATGNGTALAGSDYVAVSGQVSFATGQTQQTVRVPIVGDTVGEANETFTVALSNPGGVTIADGSATGTITNDDGPLYFALAGGNFAENWTDTSRISSNDNWSNVPHIIGYLGDIDSGSPTGVDPRTLTGAALGAVDVIANLTATTSLSGGVGEFQIADPTIGLQGSGSADAPSIVLYMDSTGRSDIRLQATLRDIDGTTDNAAQPINVQYRTDPNGAWTNVDGAYFSDVTTGGSATQTTALDVILPAGANNSPTLQIRIMTTNAAGNDEWVGIDDIVVSSAQGASTLSIADSAAVEGTGGSSQIVFTVTRAGDASQAVTADYAISFAGGGFSASAGDIAETLSGQVSFAAGETSQTIVIDLSADATPEADEAFTVTLSSATLGTIGDGVATGTIVNDDGEPPFVTINDVSVVEGQAGTSVMTFTVTRTGGSNAFTVDFTTADVSATAGSDYVATSGTLSFGVGENSKTVSVTINGDTDSELGETLELRLSNPTGNAVIADGTGVGTIASDDPIYIHDIQGTSYFSPILTAEGITGFDVASTTTVIVRAVVTAVDNVGNRQGYYLTEELADWDANPFTSEGIFVMTRDDAGVGAVVSGVSVGDIIEVTAQVMEYQPFSNMPRTVLVNPTGLSIISSGNALPPPVVLIAPNSILTAVTPDYTDSADGAGDTFDASLYALSYFETVEGMRVVLQDAVVADGFVETSGGQPFFKAYSAVHADQDQINSRGGYTIAGDPPLSPPDTADAEDGTLYGGRHLHDGDANPDIVEIDFTDFAIDAPAGLAASATMGDHIGDVTGIIEFDFTDLKLVVLELDQTNAVDTNPTRETTTLGGLERQLTVATFNVENLDPGDGAARFTAIAEAIATNLNAPDILIIEEMQDNNGAVNDVVTDASLTWQMLVDALNLATGKVYQWVDQDPVDGAEGGEPGGNIRVGFLYDTGRVQLGDLAADAPIEERRKYTDRIGDGLRDAGDLIAYSDDMIAGEINPADWSGTRLSLLGEFSFNGHKVFVTGNHFPAKGGSGNFWQFDQTLEDGDPENAGWAKRVADAQDVYAMLDLIEQGETEAAIVSGGDYNDFYFYRPLEVVTGHVLADGTARVGGSRFDNLTVTELTEAERYTYTFDGRSQALDHMVVSQTLGAVASYDIVHLNTGFNGSNDPSISDHDPALSSFDFRYLSEVLTGTADADFFLMSHGGDDQVSGLGGDDRFRFDREYTSADKVDGGEGNDTLILGGDYPNLVFTADSLVSVENILLLSGAPGDLFSYSLTTVDANVAAGVRLRVDASRLTPNESLFFDGSAETDGSFRLIGGGCDDTFFGSALGDYISGGDGNDVIYGLKGDDTIYGGLGYDLIQGGAGRDVIGYLSAAESTGTDYDTLEKFQRGADTLDLPVTVAGWASAASGKLDFASFNQDLAAAVDASLGANQAISFTATTGDMAGKTFLVVDADGDGNYQAGQDFVFEILDPIRPLDGGNFFA